MALPFRPDVSIAFRRSAPRLPQLTPATKGNTMKSLHCLSAFCPPASQIKSDDRLWRMRVSIAFRRSAPRLPKQNAWSVSRSGGVSIAFRRSAPRLPGECTAENIRELFSLHCLSAFCPPASLHRQAKRSFSPARSPLPFGVLPPGFEGDKLWAEGDKLWVSIAFRRSAPRLPVTDQRSSPTNYVASPLPFGVLPPGF